MDQVSRQEIEFHDLSSIEKDIDTILQIFEDKMLAKPRWLFCGTEVFQKLIPLTSALSEKGLTIVQHPNVKSGELIITITNPEQEIDNEQPD